MKGGRSCNMFKIIDILNIKYMYIIDEYGDVFSVTTNRKLRKAITNKGYYYYTLMCNNGKAKKFTVHSLVALMFVDGYKKGLIVNHKDGVKINNYYKNLEWVTYLENNLHALEHNLLRKGEENSNAILSNEQVKIICELLSKNFTVEQIVYQLGKIDMISLKNTITNIKMGKTWKHIRKNYDIDMTPGNTVYTKDDYKRVMKLIDKGIGNKQIVCEIFGYKPSDTKKYYSRLAYVKKLRKKYKKANGSTTIESDYVFIDMVS